MITKLDQVPLAHLSKPLSQSRLCFVSSAGVQPKGTMPFDLRCGCFEILSAEACFGPSISFRVHLNGRISLRASRLYLFFGGSAPYSQNAVTARGDQTLTIRRKCYVPNRRCVTPQCRQLLTRRHIP